MTAQTDEEQLIEAAPAGADETPHLHAMHEAFRQAVIERLDRGSLRMDALDRGLEANTKMTAELKGDTEELLEIFKSLKGGLKVLGWIGTGFKWIASLGVAGLALWKAIANLKGGA